MNPCNFACLMERVRTVCFILPLLLWSSCVFSATRSDTTIPERSDDVNLFEENGKIGLKNRRGEILIPPQYDALGWSDGSFSVIDNVTGYALKGRWGLINLTNQKVTKAEFHDLSPGHASIILARKKIPNTVSVLTGCINTAGKIVIPFHYDGIKLTDLRAIVWKKDKGRFNSGIVDFDNRVIIPLSYRHIYSLGTLRFAVTSFDNKTAIFSENGEQLTAFSIDSISSFRNNYAVIYQDRLQGLINREGKTLLEPVYRDVNIDDERTVRTRLPDEWLFLDGENTLVRNIHADVVEPVDRERYRVGVSGNYQLVGRDFKAITATVFNDIGMFRNGRAIVEVNGKKGLIRRDGILLIPPKYSDLIEDGALYRAMEVTTSGERSLLLDSTGSVLTQKGYQF
ncbi:MAG TPA: WG repeat-containing protein, partial [Chryseosolibacter sp.]|nr:WG repeat-containing protein [Chryseosolibacter sp.]